ncbi:MAG TPA: GNAT family N-acetyltransferase [Acidimicrobiia bacterium]|nr:GNAT family N-acetyltransferase [Acidimicrobiia bacterium]
MKPPNIAARTSEVCLRDGSTVILRPAVPADRELLIEGFKRLSPESRYRRFFAPMKEMSAPLLDYLTSIDYRDHFAWAALSADAGPDGRALGVGVSRYIRLEDPEAAEMAVTVVDDWQGRGLGRVLLDALVLEALENGITRLEGDVLVENRPMQELLRHTGATFRPGGPGVFRFSIDLPAREEALRGDPLGDLLRAVAKGEASLYQDEPCPWLAGVESLPSSGLEG